MTDAPLSPEQVAEIRHLVAKEKRGDSLSDRYSAASLLQATVDLLADREHLRAELERAEEALLEIRREADPDRIRETGREPRVDEIWYTTRDALNRMEAEDE